MTQTPGRPLPVKNRPSPSVRSLNQWLRDADTLFRGSVDEFMVTLRSVIAKPWGPFMLETTPVEQIDGVRRLVKPRRFDVRLMLKGAVWRRVRVEVAFPEGANASRTQPVPAPSAGFFGVDTPDHLVGIAMDYQVAQKIHARTDPDTPEWVNDRVRDVTDLNLLHDHFYPGEPPASLKAACVDLFNARAAEAMQSGDNPRYWPPVVAANHLWRSLYPDIATSIGLDISLDEATAKLNTWIQTIDSTNWDTP